MRIKKKFILGNLLALFSFIIVLWMFKDPEDVALQDRRYLQNGGPEGRGLLGKFIPKQLFTRVNQCFSNIRSYKITADFTLNDIYDRMQLSIGNFGLKALLDETHFKLEDRVVKTKETSHPPSQPLEVIVIPHSHNDPGWKKTYMQYFLDQTTHILSLMVDKLTEYPDMTFIWVESCFLHTWWTNQTVAVRDKFRELVQSGRIEIVSGMWVAPDEASPHYFALIDQLIEGHYWVKKHLNVVPESSLNFDQFGYSASMPYLVKKAGLKHVLIKRVHRGVKQIFGEKKWMNFYWRQFWDHAGDNDIFSLIDTYEWMSISDSCGPDRSVCNGLDFAYMQDLPKPGTREENMPMVSDWTTRKQVGNMAEFVGALIEQFRLKAANYQPGVMMLPHGGDFRFDTAEEWDRQYRNMKVFMKYVNDRKSKYNVNMRFGTLKDYFEEVEKQSARYELEYPVISGDFFTYTEGEDYWTGYFTTRQFDKRLSREALESLRAAELMMFVVMQDAGTGSLPKSATDSMLRKLSGARQDIGIFQHHDAITGTAQAHVAEDYEQMLTSAFTKTQQILAEALAYVVKGGRYDDREESVVPTIKHEVHNKLTQRVVVPIYDGKDTKVLLFNSLTQKRSEVVVISVNKQNVRVFDNQGNQVTCDVLHRDVVSGGGFDLMFKVNFPPVSVLTYTVRSSNSPNSISRESVNSQSKHPGTCENEFMNVTFSPNTGSPIQVCYKKESFCTSLNIDWRQYTGNGGAYSMRSLGAESPADTTAPEVKFTKGNTLCQVRAVYKLWRVTYTLPRSNGAADRALRINIRTDLTSVANKFNGDIAMRVTSDVDSNNTFYVDSNSFQMMGRRFRTNIPFDGNVYPMSSMAFMEDSRRRLVVHSAQPHGVISRTSGTLDIMLDRTAPLPEMDMPEPVRDSKPTETILLLEILSTVDIERTETLETAIPTLNSIYINDILQHPIFKFFTHDTNIPESRVTFLQNEISCDLIIANIKNLLNEKDEYDGTSLTLFRRSVACNSKNSNNYLCSISENVKFAPGDLIGRTNRKSTNYVTEVSLSHLYTKQTVFMDDQVGIDPMDIKTFHIKQNAH